MWGILVIAATALVSRFTRRSPPAHVSGRSTKTAPSSHSDSSYLPSGNKPLSLYFFFLPTVGVWGLGFHTARLASRDEREEGERKIYTPCNVACPHSLPLL